MKKVWSFLKAFFSLQHGINTLDIYWKRESACLGYTTGTPCDALIQLEAKHLYCGACGCPKLPQADLRVKWLLPGAVCPKEKWEVTSGDQSN